MESDSQRWANVAKMGMGIFDTLIEANDELAFKKYSTEMLNNPEYTPDMSAKDFNVKAYNKAKTTVLVQQLQSEQIKKARFEAWKNDSEKSRTIASDLFSKAQAFTDDADLPKSFKYYEQAYEAVNTGTDIEIDKDGMGFTEKDYKTGKTEHLKFKSQRDMVAHFQQYGQALKDPKAFTMNHIRTAQQTAAHNIERMEAGEEVFDDQGNRAIKITGLLDPKTGKPRGAVYDINGRQVEEADLHGYTFRTLKSRETEAGIGVKMADIKEKTAAAAKHLADAKKAGNEAVEKNLSTEEKVARFYKKAYGLDTDAEAANMVRNDELNKQAFAAIAKYIQENEPDLSNEKERKEFLKFRDQVISGAATVSDANVPKGKGLGEGKGSGEKVTRDSLKAEYAALRKSGKSRAEAEAELRKKYPGIVK